MLKKTAMVSAICILVVLILSLSFAGCSSPAPSSTSNVPPKTSAAAPSSTPASAVKTLTFSIHTPPAHYTVTNIATPWAQELEKRTNGRYKVTIYPNQTLAKSNEQFDMMLKDSLDITMLVGAHYPGRFPLADIFELPFTVPYLSKAPNGQYVRDIITQKYIAPLNFKEVHLLFTGSYAPNIFHMVTKPVSTMADFKGMIIGNAGGKTMPALIKALGGTPETVLTTDAYQALQKGMVNGQLLPLETEVSFKLNEVVKYVTMSNFPSASIFFIMNQKTWNSFSPADQKIIEDLNVIAEKAGDDAALAAQDAAKTAISGKIQIIEVSAAERANWAKAAQDLETSWVKEVDGKGFPASQMVSEVHTLTGQ